LKYFQPIGSFDPIPLLSQVQRQPSLWDTHRLRTTHANSPHMAVSDIWVRFNDISEYERTGNVSTIMDQHESIWYPAADKLPAIRPLVSWLMSRIDGIRLGRIIITKLAPGKKIDRHADSGDHAAYYERYHFVLQGLPGSIFNCGDETVQMPTGSVFWFQNQIEHEVINNSADDRVHMIVDIKT
jgi:hypothetical protein